MSNKAFEKELDVTQYLDYILSNMQKSSIQAYPTFQSADFQGSKGQGPNNLGLYVLEYLYQVLV